MPSLGDRSLFPDLQARSYLAHCAISPVSLPVRAAVSNALDAYARLGVGAVPGVLTERAALRSLLAGLIGARPDDVAIVANTTSAVVGIAQSLAWRTGDRVVVFSGEFPTNVTPWQQAAARHGLEVVRLPLDGFGLAGTPYGAGLERLEHELRQGVRLVAVSAVQFSSGLAMPLSDIARLCRQHGAELFVDAIQAVGAQPLDVGIGIDYLAAGSHKWLMGTEGCALLYVAPTRVASLVPRLAGWMSHEDAFGFLFGASELRHDRAFRVRADAFESGAPNVAGHAALQASAGLIATLGADRVFTHLQAWHDAIEAPLTARGFRSLRGPPGARSGILSLEPPAGVDAQALVRGLAAAGVVVTAPENRLRLAPHWPNALEEVPVVLAAVDEALRGVRAAGASSDHRAG